MRDSTQCGQHCPYTDERVGVPIKLERSFSYLRTCPHIIYLAVLGEILPSADKCPYTGGESRGPHKIGEIFLLSEDMSSHQLSQF
jgi:hypothetical protein